MRVGLTRFAASGARCWISSEAHDPRGSVTGVMVAAGASRRFGGNKLLAMLGTAPVIRWSAEAVLTHVDALVVVVPPGADGLGKALEALPCRFVEHAGHARGMGSSIAAGVASAGALSDAVCLTLADEPLLRGEVVSRCVAEWRRTGAPAVRAVYDNGPGHPVVFGRECYAALARFDGDTGARSVLEALGDAVVTVQVPGAAPVDVDTPEALAVAARFLNVGP